MHNDVILRSKHSSLSDHSYLLHGTGTTGSGIDATPETFKVKPTIHTNTMTRELPVEPPPAFEPPSHCMSFNLSSSQSQSSTCALAESLSPSSSVRRSTRRRNRSPRRRMAPLPLHAGKDEDTNDYDTVTTATTTTASQSTEQEHSEEILSFGQFACDAIQTELEVKVVLLEAAQIPNADRVYSLMQCEDPLSDELCHTLPLVRLELTKYELRQITYASRISQQLPYLCASSSWDNEWEFVCEQDTEMLDVALPLRILQLDETPTISRVAQRLHLNNVFPRDDDWIPGVLLVLRHLCKIHDVPHY